MVTKDTFRPLFVEEIDDPSAISAFDYKKSAFWDLDVDLD
jgi:hypothetical protein